MLVLILGHFRLVSCFARPVRILRPRILCVGAGMPCFALRKFIKWCDDVIVLVFIGFILNVLIFGDSIIYWANEAIIGLNEILNIYVALLVCVFAFDIWYMKYTRHSYVRYVDWPSCLCVCMLCSFTWILFETQSKQNSHQAHAKNSVRILWLYRCRTENLPWNFAETNFSAVSTVSVCGVPKTKQKFKKKKKHLLSPIGLAVRASDRCSIFNRFTTNIFGKNKSNIYDKNKRKTKRIRRIVLEETTTNRTLFTQYGLSSLWSLLCSLVHSLGSLLSLSVFRAALTRLIFHSKEEEESRTKKKKWNENWDYSPPFFPAVSQLTESSKRFNLYKHARTHVPSTTKCKR